MSKMNKIVQNEKKVQQRKRTKNKKSPKLFQKCAQMSRYLLYYFYNIKFIVTTWAGVTTINRTSFWIL